MNTAFIAIVENSRAQAVKKEHSNE
jgi:hypothetical protein